MAWRLYATNTFVPASMQGFIYSHNIGDVQFWRLPAGAQGVISVALSNVNNELWVDGVDTDFNDLGDDFAIQNLTVTEFAYSTGEVDIPSFPSGALDFTGPSSADVLIAPTWTLQPIGFNDGQILFTGTGLGFPANPTKWNAILNVFIQQLFFQIRFDNTGNLLNYYVEYNPTVPMYITGADFLLPPPPNIEMMGIGSLDFGEGESSVQVLYDASGIYTLTPGLYRDELWQRQGTTATVTSFAIPRPFFKTGYLGDK